MEKITNVPRPGSSAAEKKRKAKPEEKEYCKDYGHMSDGLSMDLLRILVKSGVNSDGLRDFNLEFLMSLIY